MRNFILAAIAILNAASAAAQSQGPSCGSLGELLNRVGPALTSPRDQGGTEWCNSYVASDLVSHETRRAVSVFHISAIGYAADLEIRRANGSVVWNDADWLARPLDERRLLDSLSGRWVCTEAALPSVDATDVTRAIQALNNVKACAASRPLDECLAGRAEALAPIAPDAAATRAILEASVRESLPRLADRLMTAHCGASELVLIPHLNATVHDADKHTQRPTEEERDSYMDLLSRVPFAGAAFIPERLTNPADDGGSHIATTLGTYRDQNGRCLILFRNSWGADGCGDLIHAGEGVVCNPAPGMFALSAERLRGAITGVAAIEGH